MSTEDLAAQCTQNLKGKRYNVFNFLKNRGSFFMKVAWAIIAVTRSGSEESSRND